MLVLLADFQTSLTIVFALHQTQGIKLLLMMGVLRYRIVTLEDLVQVVMWEIQEVDRGLTIPGDIGTMLVLLRRRLKLLKLEIQNLGTQWSDATTAMEKVIWLLRVLNQEIEAVHFTSKHCYVLLRMKQEGLH